MQPGHDRGEHSPDGERAGESERGADQRESQSLTKHLVDRAGLEAVVKALVSGRNDALEAATRRSDEDWRREWLAVVG